VHWYIRYAAVKTADVPGAVPEAAAWGAAQADAVVAALGQPAIIVHRAVLTGFPGDQAALSLSFCASLFVLIEFRYTTKRQTKNSVIKLMSIVPPSTT